VAAEEKERERRAISAIFRECRTERREKEGGGDYRHAVLKARTNRWRGGISRGGLQWQGEKKDIRGKSGSTCRYCERNTL